jgi:two-component system chemotaxis response regulator CheY
MKATRSAPLAKLVVVIDDDRLILEATEGLLRCWGCRAVAARSCDEALVRLAETEAGRRPDVIVCDYQLSRGVTGVDAIERLRSAFPIPALIPALLISGDASSPRCEVGSRGYHLLYKPVNPGRFHAALVRPPRDIESRANPAIAIRRAAHCARDSRRADHKGGHAAPVRYAVDVDAGLWPKPTTWVKATSILPP